MPLQCQKGKSEDYPQALGVYEAKRARQPELKLAAVDYEAAIAALGAHGAGDVENPSRLACTNGLDDAENRILFATASLDDALHLIMKRLGHVALPRCQVAPTPTTTVLALSSACIRSTM